MAQLALQGPALPLVAAKALTAPSQYLRSHRYLLASAAADAIPLGALGRTPRGG